MKITYQQLEELDACENQLDLFRELFGDEVELTEKIVMTHGPKFNLDWAATRLFFPAANAEYRQARTAAFWEIAKTLERVR